MMKKKYEVDEKVVLRVPLFPINKYYELFCSNNNEIEKNLSEYAVQEMISIASKNLLPELLKELANDKGISKKVLQSCIKYLIRSSSRCTPYGICAGVALMEMSHTTNVEVTENVCKRSRPDMGWVFSVIKKIEKEEKILQNLKIMVNPMCYNKSGRIINPYYYAKDNSHARESISIKYTKQVRLVEELVKDRVSYKELYCKMQERNKDVPSEIIHNFLKDLIDEGYLLTELWSPLVNENPFEYLIKKLEVNPEAHIWHNQLKDILYELKKYDGTAIGLGMELRSTILQKMSVIKNSQEYLQVECERDLKGTRISYKIGDCVEETIEMLLKISDEKYERPYLADYKSKFLEKYGYSAAVPILELLDEDMGIGLPENYKQYNSVNSSYNYSKSHLREFLDFKYEEALYNNQNEIILTDEDVELLCMQDKKEFEYPSSLEVCVKVISDGQDAINQGNFRIQFVGAEITDMAGKSLGRFSGQWESNMEKRFHEKECDIEKEKIFVEISEYPLTARTANVCICNSGREYYTLLGSYIPRELNNISLKDIYVGVNEEDGKFYLKSKKLNKILVIKNSNMLNHILKSPYARFLTEISLSDSIPLFETMSEFNNNERIFTPRVVYKKAIIRPATWKVNIEYTGRDEKSIIGFLRRWKIPDFVYLCQNDNMLLLNLNQSEHVEILTKELKKGSNSLWLQEAFVNMEKNWLKDNKNNIYENEMIFSLFRTQNEKESRYILPQCIKTKNQISDLYDNYYGKKAIVFGQNEGWIYIKLYGDKYSEDKLIGHDIPLLCDMLEKKGILEKHFFIRYYDPKRHIRLRIKVTNSTEGLFFITKWAEALLECRGILNFSVEPYYREYMRYGGLDLIEYAEDVFWRDSELMERIIKYSEEHQVNDREFGIYNTIMIMKAFGLTNIEIEKWMSINIPPQSYRIEFKAHRKDILSLIDKIEKNEVHIGDIELIGNREESIKKYKRKIDYFDDKGTLTNFKDSILSSLIHMSANRYMCDNRWENEIRALTRNGFYSYVQKKKYVK